MKNLTKFAYLALSLTFILSACSTDDDDNDHIHCSVDAPATYAFEHEGTSTVSYTGQAARLAKAKEVYDMMNADLTVTSADITTLIDDANSKLVTKTAENDPNRAVIIGHLNNIFDTYAANSAAFEAGTQASEGVAGLAGSYELDANGWEADQLYAKMLIGALCLEQVNYDYLTKMDVDNTDRNYSAPNVYTKREHYFDEAYGYVYGLDDNDADAAINNGLLLGKYLNKHVGAGDYPNDWRGDVYNAFKTGRQAVVEDCQEVLDEQIAIINETLSKVVAWHAEGYLRDAASELGTDDYYHSVSEGWGFVYSLQFTKMSDGTPLFTHAEVMDMITTMEDGDGTGNGAYGLDANTLNGMADQIANAVSAY
tara:strand:- start:566 stop:1669 length:1104 start_codon:yes stop_codon:yes gene_type:complete